MKCGHFIYTYLPFLLSIFFFFFGMSDFLSCLFPFSLKICPNLLEARTRFSWYYLPLSFLRTRTSQILTLLTQGPLKHRNPDSATIILLEFLLPKSLVTSCSQINAFFLALVDAFNTIDQSHLS